MIRLVASTIVEPSLIRNKSTMEQYIKDHILHLPYMIRSFRNAIVTVSRESKWCKLFFLKKYIPIEIFDLVKPFLINQNIQQMYPNVSLDQFVRHRKYLLVESKLYRHGLIHKNSFKLVREYIEELQLVDWHLCKFTYNRRILFIKCVIELLYIYTGKGFDSSAYETEYALRYWL